MTVPPSVTRLAQRCFGKPIIRNALRGELVEEIVAMALEPEWMLCAGDWAAFDLKQANGPLRIQVKQSAALQSWSKADARPPKPCFSISQKTGRWEDGDRWVEEVSRNAEIYIFGWHDRADEGADHREPDQWQFFVVPERDMPAQKSLSLSTLRKLAGPVTFGELAQRVSDVSKTITG
ncbi:MAG: hypothetical protein ABIO68_06005 [Sphingomicrobium sp.]